MVNPTLGGLACTKIQQWLNVYEDPVGFYTGMSQNVEEYVLSRNVEESFEKL